MKKLINNGRRRLGVPGHPAIVLSPGESAPVTEKQIAGFQRNKTVSRWMEMGTLALIDDDGTIEEPKRTPKPKTGVRPKRDIRKEVVLPKGLTGEGIETHHKGGGWYRVYVNGFEVTDRNVRKDEAKSISTEYE